MSICCKVCNTAKKSPNQKDSNTNWKCTICDNLLDANGNVITTEQS